MRTAGSKIARGGKGPHSRRRVGTMRRGRAEATQSTAVVQPRRTRPIPARPRHVRTHRRPQRLRWQCRRSLCPFSRQPPFPKNAVCRAATDRVGDTAPHRRGAAPPPLECGTAPRAAARGAVPHTAAPPRATAKRRTQAGLQSRPPAPQAEPPARSSGVGRPGQRRRSAAARRRRGLRLPRLVAVAVFRRRATAV